MRFEELLARVGQLPYFDLATVAQLFTEDRVAIRTQLSRWIRAGKLVSLRRGLYAPAEPYRRSAIHPAALANDLYRPSYLSGEWALGYYELIPELVVTYTSVTSRKPTIFENRLGVFRYISVKRSAFFGYKPVTLDGAKVLLAEPEKALLDYWYAHHGEWTAPRLAEMRYQNFELVNRPTLLAYSRRFDSPRLVRAAQRWIRLAETEASEGVDL